uniref:Uncharacterized protein n=1 Tax=Solanum tuberosum TaxID=4113 RepID=M1DSZ9_SOLTU
MSKSIFDDSGDLGSIQFTTSESQSEEAVGSSTPEHTLMPEVELAKMKHLAWRSKTTHDPLTLPLAPPPSQVPQVPLVPVHPPRSTNRLKVVGWQFILEKKQLSTSGVVNKHPTVWETLRYKIFKQFSKPQNLYVPIWVREIYEWLTKLVPKGKKKEGLMAPVDFFEVHGKKVKCSETYINDELDCTTQTRHFLADKIKL